ncbi:MAG: histidine kinase [bacterium]|nr:histidine kinase [bacterium]
MLTTQQFLALQTTCFSVGCTVFVMLTWLFARYVGAVANARERALARCGAVFALSATWWCVASLAFYVAMMVGWAESIDRATWIRMRFSPVAVLPTVALVFLWLATSPDRAAVSRWRRTLVGTSFLLGAVCLAAVWFVPRQDVDLAMILPGANQLVHAVFALPLLIGSEWVSRPVRRFVIATTWTGFAMAAATAAMLWLAPRSGLLLLFVVEQFALVWAVLAFGLFAPFRFADRFAHSCGALAVTVVWAFGAYLSVDQLWSGATHAPLLAIAIGVVMLLAYLPARRLANRWIDRFLLRRADHRAVRAELRAALDCAASREEVEDEVSRVLSAALDVEEVWLRESEGQESDRERMMTATGGYAAIAWRARGREPRLLSGEALLLQEVSQLVGRHLDRIGREEQRARQRELEASLAEASLVALRAQLDPHFLFNALNMLAELVRSDPVAAEQMVERLSRVLRHVLEGSQRPTARLADEVRFLQAYLDVLHARFGSRLRVEFAVEEDTLAVEVPSLLLQPLVENAVEHGIGPQREGGTVRVRAWNERDVLCMDVVDDGVGGCPEFGAGAGFGMRSVHDRLVAFAGQDSRLSIDSPPGDGTTVSLRMRRPS